MKDWGACRDQGWEWLLTKGPAHSALLLADPTLSRASPLPQGTVVDEGLGGLAAIKGGSGLAHEGAGTFSIAVD